MWWVPYPPKSALLCNNKEIPLVEKQRLQVAIIYLRYSRACLIHGCILPLTRKLTLNFHACLHILFSLLPLREWETARRQSSVNNSWPFDEGKDMVTWEFKKRSFLRQFKGDCWQNTFTGLTIKRALIFHCYNVFSHTSTSRFRSPLTTDPPPPGALYLLPFLIEHTLPLFAITTSLAFIVCSLCM